MTAFCDLAVEAAILDDVVVSVYRALVVEAAVLNDAATTNGPGFNAVEHAILNDAMSQTAVLSFSVVETARIHDRLKSVYLNIAAESAVLNDSVAQLPPGNLAVEAAVLNDAAETLKTASASLVERAVLNDAIQTILDQLIVETAILDDATATFRITETDAVEAAVLNDAMAADAFEYLVESAILDDDTVSTMICYNNAVDSMLIYDSAIGGGSGGAWATNLDTFPLTRYTNQPFTSAAVVGGFTLFAGPTGVYRASGETDAGTVAIDAAVVHDLTDLLIDDKGKPNPNPSQKRPRHAYVSFTSSGPVTFKLGHVTDDSEDTATYLIPEAKASSTVNGRVPLGRGIRSRFLRPAIYSYQGSSFKLNDGKIVIDVLKRGL